jgi:hypothetical protein
VHLFDLLSPNNETNREKHTAMNKENTVVALAGREQFSDTLTDLLRTGAGT